MGWNWKLGLPGLYLFTYITPVLLLLNLNLKQRARWQIFTCTALGTLYYHSCVYLICVDGSKIAINVLKAASPLLFWCHRVLFWCSPPFFRNVLRWLKIGRRVTHSQMWGRRPALSLVLKWAQWHSARNCSRGAIHCAENRHSGRFFFCLHLVLVFQVRVNIYIHQHSWLLEGGHNMQGHTGDLTSCHCYDKAEVWLMSDRWTGDNGQGMCSVWVKIWESAVWLGI